MLPTPPPSPILSTCAPEDRLGLVLAGRLRLDTILGVGAYGVVYVARDLYTLRQYAVKALNKVGLDARQRRFQQREIQLHHAASLHRNVVSLVEVLEAEDTTYVVLEYCPEGDLFSLITERMFYLGNDDLVRDAFLQIVSAVEHCHSIGIYHRDLKPENVLVTDGGHTLKLADFGLATQDRYSTDFGCGSTFYMSSECHVASPSPQATYASAPNDVWALGVILTNLACGRNPWKRASVEDPTFRAYLKDPHFLTTILPISHELEHILRRIFDCNPLTRVTLPELRALIERCPRFTAPPQRQVLPLSPPPSEYSPAVSHLPEQVICAPPEAALPPSPPVTPPATAVAFAQPPPAKPKPEPTFHSYPPSPISPPRSSRTQLGQCAPRVAATFFNAFASTHGHWTQPPAFSNHLSALVPV